MSRRTFILILAAGLAVGAAAWRLRPTDEAKIRRAMGTTVAALEKSSAESAIASIQRAERAVEAFADECAVDIGRTEVPSVASRGELRQMVFQGRAMLSSLRIDVRDESVVLSPDRTGATHRFTALVTADRRGSEDSAVKELEVRWIRSPDGWRIRSIRPVEAIRPLR